MREIEFRGISTENGQWIYGYLYHGLNDLIYINTVVELSEKSKCNQQILVHSETVGQYTGLKDKNGVKIFEGDVMSKVAISELGNEIQYFYIVFWSSSDQGFKTKQYVLDENESGVYWRIKNEGFFDYISMIRTYNHVIGNIHQNKELLQ